MRRALVASLAALALLGVGACGGDDDDDTTSTIPDITIPEGEAEQTTPAPTTTPAPETGSGGTTLDPSKPDSPTNDLPPEPNTPESRFEEFCKENPGACG